MAEKEYIERGALLKTPPFTKCGGDLSAYVEGYLDCAEEARKAVNDAPAADVIEVRHGEWKTTGAYPHFLYCSECNRKFIPNMEWIGIYDIPTNYCPCCGAKMYGERKDGGNG